MPKARAKLSNCYVPLPLPPESSIVTLAEDGGARSMDVDDDGGHSLRRLRLETGVITSASGSALVELGDTKVLAQVTGPVTGTNVPSHVELNMDHGVLHCSVVYAPFCRPASSILASTCSSATFDTRDTQQTNRMLRSFVMARETDLELGLSSALAAAVPLEPYPKCALLLQLTVLQDDGSVLSAGVTAASLALQDAAVPLYDVVTACTTTITLDGPNAVVRADPTFAQQEAADSVVTLAMCNHWNEVTLWEQSGRVVLQPELANQAIQVCRNGCRTLHKFVREHWITLHQEQNDDNKK